ncbi:hypothetical protein H4R19_001888 [Coemansia spiralis]|nr:hypothetical protein H4R19_001888 [Coemansia spiralis]
MDTELGDAGHAPPLASDDAELEELRRVRRALGKMNQGIENVQRQMKYFNSSVGQTTQLLDLWVQVLSQATHNQGFLLDEDWQGGSMDTARLNDLVQRDARRRQDAERHTREQELRKERELAEARERERQRAENAAMAETAAAKAPGQRPPAGPGRRPPASRGRRRGAGLGGPGRGRGQGTSIPSAGGSRIRPPR